MNKLPTKQIYLLIVIIVGILALSVYSTYALFTFESSTSNVVNIHIAKSLSIEENVYEYQQLTISSNSISTTDVDIYNDFSDDICYSIWYKFVDKNIDNDMVKIFQISDNTITSSGVLNSLSNVRVKIGIINDTDKDIKINLGTAGMMMNDGSCSLNLSDDKMIIDSKYEMMEYFNDIILDNKDSVNNIDMGYLVYKDNELELTYKLDDKIFVSDKFSYRNELFTLDNPYLTVKEIIDDDKVVYNDLYLCLDNSECNILYKIDDIVKLEKNIEDDYDKYMIIISDKLVGYLGGSNGLRKINDNYIYYGDNPNNYVYFNCDSTENTDNCELWRIVGVYYNSDTKKYNVKIINNNSIGKYLFDKVDKDNFNWVNSNLRKYLNDEYKLNKGYDNFIDTFKEKLEFVSLDDKSIKRLEDTEEVKFSIISLSEYLYTSECNIKGISEYNKDCLNSNWLNNIEVNMMWTKTVLEDTIINLDENEEEKELNISYVYSVGNDILYNDVSLELDVRPVVYLKDRIVVVAGDGSFSNPYVIK